MKKDEREALAVNEGMGRRGFLATAGAALAAGLLPSKAFAQEPA